MRRAAAAVAVLTLLAAPDCTRAVDARATSTRAGGGGGAGGAGGASAEDGVVIGAAVWTLAWDMRGVDVSPGGGWSVENDLGYRVHVSSGWIVDHSASLGPCVVPDADGGTTALGFRFGIRAAHAHEDADRSAIFPMHAEDLSHPEGAGPWPNVFPATRYCRAQWLVARATTPSDAPAGVDLSNTSVRVAGTWERDGEAHRFDVDTWWPEGHVGDLASMIDPAAFAAAQGDGETRWAWITVTRRLGGVFDGIDFDDDSDLQVTGRVLDNLLGESEIAVELRAPNAG